MKLTALLCPLALLVSVQLMANPLPEAGRTIFMSRCAACHSVNKQLTGPALAGVYERRTTDWIVKFVQSSQTVIKRGDKDAVALFEKFNKITMPDHPDLTSENIQNIVEFIKLESKSIATENTAPFARSGKLKPNFMPLSISNYGFFITYFGLVALLIATMLFMVRVKEYQRLSNNSEAGAS